MDSKYIEHWLTIGGFSLTMAGAIEAVMTLAQRIGLPGSVSHWSSKPLMTGVFEFTSTVMLGVTCVGLGEIVRLLRKSGKALRFKHEHRLISMARTAFVAAPMMGACAGFFAGMKAWKLAMAEPSGFLAMGSVVVKSVVSFAATFAWTVGITLALA